VLLLALAAALATATPAPTPRAVAQGATVSAAPRSLADVARERRGKPKPKGTFSTADGSIGSEPAGDAGAEKGAGTAPSNEAGWRSRAAAAREELAKAEAAVAALQTEGGTIGNSMYERARRRAATDIAEKRVARARQRLGALEDEARRAGVPPGWLR
jgi:hypothetical protein